MDKRREQDADPVLSRKQRAYNRRNTCCIEEFQGAARAAHVDWRLPTGWAQLDDVLQLADAAGSRRLRSGVCGLVAQFLHARLADDQPCSWLGSETLLSVNPRRAIVNQYSAEAIAAHQRWAALGLVAPPHVYSVAQAAVDGAVAALLQPEPEQTPSAAVANEEASTAASVSGGKRRLDHVICCVGDTGSGKTEAVRAALGYLAHASISRRQPPLLRQEGCMEHQIIAANEVVDAFGRARLNHSPHSSRLGRSLQVKYDEQGCMVAANLETHCLESSRVARPQKLEGSNFAVFYLLCDGASDQASINLHLAQQTPSISIQPTSFALLSEETCTVPADLRKSNENDFNGLQRSLVTVGVDTHEQRHIWELLAAILLLGNLEVEAVGETGSSTVCTVAQTPAVEHAARLMQILGNPWDDGQLLHALSTATRSHGTEETVHHMDEAGILRNRDRLVVALYDGLLAWLTKRINDKLNGRRLPNDASPPAKHQRVQPTTATASASVWLMDTLGFDSAAAAQRNYGASKFGFDRFCANYAAEKLHHQYIEHAFRKEEEAYRADGRSLRGNCSWSVDGNDDFIATVETLSSSSSSSKPGSIFAILQDVTEQPSGTERAFRARLEEELPQHSRWSTHAGSEYGFVVRHFGQRVSTQHITYDAMDFVESNRIGLPEGIKEALLKSGAKWIQKLVSSNSAANPPAQQLPKTGLSPDAAHPAASRSVRMQNEISRLCDIIDGSSCHFVRCLVAADGFDTSLIETQLQRANVEELVTTRTHGYTERLAFDKALHRWKAVVPLRSTALNNLEATQELMSVLQMPSEWHMSADSQTVYVKARAVRRLDCLSAIAMLLPYAKGCYVRQQYNYDLACMKQLQRRIKARAAIADRITLRFSRLCADPYGAVVGECYRCFQMWFAWRGVDPVVMLEMQKLTNALVTQSRERLISLQLDNDFASIQRALEDCKGAKQAMSDEYVALEKHRDDIMNRMYQQMQNALSSPETSSATTGFSALNLFRGMRDYISDPHVDVYEALQQRLRLKRDNDEAEIKKCLQNMSDETWDDAKMARYEQFSRSYYENGMGMKNLHEAVCLRQTAHWETVHQQVQSVLLSNDHREVSLLLDKLRGYPHDNFADDIHHLRQRLEDLLTAGPARLVMQAAMESGNPITQAVALRVYETSSQSVQAVLHELVPEVRRAVEKSELLAEIALLRDTNDANRIREQLATYDQTKGDLAKEEREQLQLHANNIVASVRAEILSAQSSVDQKTVSSALVAGEKYKQDEEITDPWEALQAHYHSMLREASECIGNAIDSGKVLEMNHALSRYENWPDLKLESLRLRRDSQLQIIAENLAEMMTSTDFYAIRGTLEEHSDYKDQLDPTWHNLSGRYRELVDKYRERSLSIADAGLDEVSTADLTSALVGSCDPVIIALAKRFEKQHKLVTAEADEVISELEDWLDEMRDEHERVQTEYEGNMSKMVLRRVAMQVQHRVLREWRQLAAERTRLRRITAKLGLSTQTGSLSVNFRAWRTYVAEAARAKAVLQQATRKMQKVWLRASWVKLRRRCLTRRYGRLQAENVRAEKQTLLCQTEMQRLHALQMSRSIRQHKRTCFNAWCRRTHKHYRASRNILFDRATNRITQGLLRTVWCKWCRVIEIESYYRAQKEAERCINEVDERCNKVRIKAVFAIRSRISTLRTYFMLLHAYANASAREHQDVLLKLLQIECRRSQLQNVFDCWLDGIHTARFVKKHNAALHRERMRSAKVKMRSQSLCVHVTERRLNTDILSTFFALWKKYRHTTKQNKHAVTVGLQRMFRNATANAWVMWCEVVGQSRLLRKVAIKVRYLALKTAFDAWCSLPADEAAKAHIRQVYAEAAFGRHLQAQVRYAFNSWSANTTKRRKSRQIMSRVVHRREVAAMQGALARWIECTHVQQRERREHVVAQKLEAQQAALKDAQLLIDRSEIGHMVSPRLVMLRRAFRVWKTWWQDNHETSLILVRAWRVQIHRKLRVAFCAWWEKITSLESLSSAQLAAHGKALLRHGNGPALARWFYNRCDSVTKRISNELTQLVEDSHLYQQAIDIGGEWQREVPPSQELNGRFWLRTLPVDKATHREQTPRKGSQLLGTSPAPRSSLNRLGNPYVYVASQTRGRSDLLEGYAQTEAAAAATATPPPTGNRRPNEGMRARSGLQASASRGTPTSSTVSSRWQSSLEESSDEVRNCCVFELRME